MDARDRSIIYCFGLCGFLMAIIGPIAWELNKLLVPYIPPEISTNPVLGLILRIDAVLMYVVLLTITLMAMIYFRGNVLDVSVLLVMVLYSATLFGDACVALVTGDWDFNAWHGMQFFGINLTVSMYMYVSLVATVIALSFVNIRWWWQVVMTIPYLWNLWLAGPLVYAPLDGVLPVVIYGPPVSLVAIIINVIISILLVVLALMIRHAELGKEDPRDSFLYERRSPFSFSNDYKTLLDLTCNNKPFINEWRTNRKDFFGEYMCKDRGSFLVEEVDCNVINLDLSNCELETVPPSILDGTFKDLERLDLGGNKFPKSACDGVKIKLPNVDVSC